MNALGAKGSAVVVFALLAACNGMVADPSPDDTSAAADAPRPSPPAIEGAAPNKGATSVALDVGAPTALALDGDRVVFTTRTTILDGETVAAGGLYVADKRVPPAVLIAVDHRGASYDALVTDGTSAFVATSDGRIVTTPLAGGVEKAVATLDAPATMLSVSADYVYYAQASGAVGRVKKAGGAPAALATIDGDVRAVAADDAALYVAAAPKKTGGAAPGIVRVDLATHVAKPMASPAGEPCAMIRDGSRLFWTSAKAGEGAVQRMSVDGGGLTTVASGTFAACALAADAADLYFATTTPGALPVRSSGATPPGTGLMRAPIAGGAPTPIVEASNALAQPGAVAVDEEHIYWLTPNAVLRLAKSVR